MNDFFIVECLRNRIISFAATSGCLLLSSGGQRARGDVILNVG